MKISKTILANFIEEFIYSAPRETERDRAVAYIAARCEREELNKLLIEAIDRDNLDQVNFLLDVIQIEANYRILYYDLTNEEIESLVQYAKKMEQDAVSSISVELR